MKLSASIIATCLLLSTSAMSAMSASALADDKPQSSASTKGPYTTGWQLQGGTSLSFLGGETAKNNAFSAVHANADFLAGGYLTDHFGIFGGVRLGFGKVTASCDGCSSAAFRIPVLFQYALRDRLHGLYLEGGLSFINLVTSHAGDATGSVNDIADLESGIGYRFQHDKTSSLDLRLGLDLGAFTHAHVEVGNRSGDGAITSQALHYNVALGVTYAFAQ